MMTSLLLALAAQAGAPTIDGLPIGALAPQSLPARGCAAYLFSTGEKKALAAVAGAEAGTLRLAVKGRVLDLVRVSPPVASSFGLAPEAQYRDGALTATLTMTVVQRDDLRDGAVVSGAVLTLDQPGEDVVIVPLGGLVGCRS